MFGVKVFGIIFVVTLIVNTTFKLYNAAKDRAGLLLT